MPQTTRNIAIFISIMLLLTVATQLLYLTTLSGVGIVDGWPLRSTIWTTELLLFTGITIASLVGLARSSDMQWGWAALLVSGLTNMIQSGIGLSMFLPAAKAGAEFSPLMGTLLAGSFLFYNLAKAVLGSDQYHSQAQAARLLHYLPVAQSGFPLAQRNEMHQSSQKALLSSAGI
mgnify:CR=1 FL=1